MTNQGATEIQEQVDGKEVLDPENTWSALSTVLNTINYKFEHDGLHEMARLLNAHPICHWIGVSVSCNVCSTQGQPRTTFLAHQVRALWSIVRIWVRDSNMSGVLVADEMGFRKMFTVVAAAMICKFLAENVIVGLLLGNFVEEYCWQIGDYCSKQLSQYVL